MVTQTEGRLMNFAQMLSGPGPDSSGSRGRWVGTGQTASSEKLSVHVVGPDKPDIVLGTAPGKPLPLSLRCSGSFTRPAWLIHRFGHDVLNSLKKANSYRNCENAIRMSEFNKHSLSPCFTSTWHIVSFPALIWFREYSFRNSIYLPQKRFTAALISDTSLISTKQHSQMLSDRSTVEVFTSIAWVELK